MNFLDVVWLTGTALTVAMVVAFIVRRRAGQLLNMWQCLTMAAGSALVLVDAIARDRAVIAALLGANIAGWLFNAREARWTGLS